MPSGRGGAVTVIAGLCASLEVGVRSFAESVPAVDLAGSAALVVLPTIGEQPLLAWGLGWVFLGTLAYETYERVYRIETADVSQWRGLFAVSAVLATLTGIAVKQQAFAQTFTYGSIPTPVAQTVFFAVLALTGVRYALTKTRFYDDVFVALLLGILMAFAAALYPLPETAVIVWAVGAIGVNRVPFGPRIEQVLNDPIERLMRGVTAARSSPTGIVTSFYILCGLGISLAAILASSGTTRGNLLVLVESMLTGRATGALAASTLRANTFLLLSIFVPAVYGVWYWLRLAERLPFALTAPQPSQGFLREKHTWTDETTYRALPPGYGLPIALLYFPLVVHENVFASGDSQVPLGYLAVVVGGTLVAAGTVLWTWLRTVDVRDGADVTRVAPAAAALQIGGLVLAGRDPAPALFHELLTLSVPSHIPLGVLSALGLSIAVALGVYLPRYIPSLLERNVALGGGLSAFVVGIVVGVLSGGVPVGKVVAGLLLWAGILGMAWGVLKAGARWVASR